MEIDNSGQPIHWFGTVKFYNHNNDKEFDNINYSFDWFCAIIYINFSFFIYWNPAPSILSNYVQCMQKLYAKSFLFGEKVDLCRIVLYTIYIVHPIDIHLNKTFHMHIYFIQWNILFSFCRFSSCKSSFFIDVILLCTYNLIYLIFCILQYIYLTGVKSRL